MTRPTVRRLGVGIGIVVASAVVWWLLAGLPVAPRAWTAILLVPVPIAAIAQTRLIGDPATLPRLPVYASTSISLWLLAGLTWLAGGAGGSDARAAGLFLTEPITTLGLASACTALGIASIFAGKWLNIPESPILRRLIPDSPRERLAFAGVSLTAGFCEELVFRGYLLHWLDVVWGAPAAVTVTTVVFGSMHAYQDLRGAARASILALILCIPPLVTGSVVSSMIAHAAIDLIAGLVLGRKLAPEMA